MEFSLLDSGLLELVQIEIHHFPATLEFFSVFSTVKKTYLKELPTWLPSSTSTKKEMNYH